MKVTVPVITYIMNAQNLTFQICVQLEMRYQHFLLCLEQLLSVSLGTVINPCATILILILIHTLSSAKGTGNLGQQQSSATQNS